MTKTVIIKSIVWNDNNYKKPSGFGATSGFVAEHGYGHEEWNNSELWKWRGYKVFHTEAPDSLFEYSDNGNLGILMISQKNGHQYLVGVAVQVYSNTQEEMRLISNELNLIDNSNELWELDYVKEVYDNNKDLFMEEWNENYLNIKWKCDLDYFHWFKDPIPINAKEVTGKKLFTTMHGRHQWTSPEIAIKLLSGHLKTGHNIFNWLTEGEFDQDKIKKYDEKLKKYSSSELRKKYKIKGGGASAKEYEYWVEGRRRAEPLHAELQAQYVEYLNKKNISPIEDLNYIDVQYEIDSKVTYTEVKPTKKVLAKYAIRIAVGQLLEYQFYNNKDAHLEIVLSSKPELSDIEFSRSLNIRVLYFDEKNNTFAVA